MKRRQFGSVRRLPSGRWQVRYEGPAGRTPAPVTFRTKSEATARLAEIETDLRRGTFVDPAAGSVRLGEYADAWLGRRTDLADSTADLYRYLLRRHVRPLLGDRPLRSIVTADLAALRATAEATGGSSEGAKAYRLAATLLRSAVVDGLLLRAPAPVKGAAREPEARSVMVSVAELDALMAALPDRLAVVPTLAAWCHLRRGEIMGLRRRHVDLLRSVVSVEVSRRWAPGATEKDPKTPAGRRAVAMPPHLCPVVDDHLRRFVAVGRDAYLVTGDKGGPLGPSAWQKAWRDARESILRPDLHLHDLKGVGLTWAAASGATVAELMHRGGHASPAAALRYQRATEDRDRAVAQAMSALAVATVSDLRARSGHPGEGSGA